MVIDKVGNTGGITQTNRTQSAKMQETDKPVFAADTVSISSEAQKAQEMAVASRIVKSTPEIREDKVKEAKEKLARGDYDKLSTEMLDKIASRLVNPLSET